MEPLPEFLAKQIESTAYHEAGHMTAAIVQAMPIRASGLYVDLQGCGVANYFERPLTDLGMTELDSKERKLTIIALFAGQVAQLKFYPGCDSNGWTHDLSKIYTLCRQLHPTKEQAQIEIREDLRERTKKLMDKFWPIVGELAKALLAKPCSAMPPEEIKAGWGKGEVRYMSGPEVVALFARHNITAKIVDDGTQAYDSTQDTPHYNSLA
jgi:hypothetical protein